MESLPTGVERKSWTLRVIRLFVHPVEFSDNREFVDDAWIPVLLLTIILAALHFTMLPELLASYDDPDFVSQYAEKERISDVTARDQIAKMRHYAPYLGLLEAPIVVSAGVAGVAAVLYLVGRYRFKRRVPYPLLFSMVAWASLISGFPLLINFFARLIKANLLLPTNAAALLPKAAEGSYFYNVLLALDPFLIWQVWLMGLGFANLYEANRQKAVASVGTMFVLLAIMNAMTLTLASK